MLPLRTICTHASLSPPWWLYAAASLPCDETGASLAAFPSTRLMMSDYTVEMVNDGMQELFDEFKGATESIYQGGVWKVRVELPDAYPYKFPSISFINKIYHPNVDEMSGSVCLDVINQTWSPMFGEILPPCQKTSHSRDFRTN